MPGWWLAHLLLVWGALPEALNGVYSWCAYLGCNRSGVHAEAPAVRWEMSLATRFFCAGVICMAWPSYVVEGLCFKIFSRWYLVLTYRFSLEIHHFLSSLMTWYILQQLFRLATGQRYRYAWCWCAWPLCFVVDLSLRSVNLHTLEGYEIVILHYFNSSLVKFWDI